MTPDAALTGFTMDTRQLRAGQVFVAIKTDKRDGHDFLAAAQAAGASAALVAVPNSSLTLPQLVVADPLQAFQAIAREHRHHFAGPVIGVSGSAGKTSTKNLLALLLGGAEGGVLATEGNLNNHLGVPLTLTRLDPAVHKFAVIEAGISAPGEMAPLAAMIAPDVVLVTLIAPAHTEELGGLDGVAAEKAALAKTIPVGGIAFFPKQSAQFGAFGELKVRHKVVERIDSAPLIEPRSDQIFFTISHRADSTVLSLHGEKPAVASFILRRVSDGMAQNAVLAISAARWLGIPPQTIQARLAGWEPAKLRGEVRRDGNRLLYLDCYNANPASMADALGSFYAIAPSDQPRLFVIGGMEELGRESWLYHHELGRSLRLRPQDLAFVIGDEADAVQSGALACGAAAAQVIVTTTLEPIAVRLAGWHGAVFVKGSRRYALEKILEPGAVEVHG